MSSKHTAVVIWKPDVQHGIERVPIDGSVCLDADGGIAGLEALSARVSCIIVQPVRAATGAIGAAIVPEEHERLVALNGTPIRAGMHTLKQGDCLDFGFARYWLSAELVAEETVYDPTVHGEEVFCFLTKARLVANQPITICPGTETTRCGVIYKSEAWELGMHQSNPPMSCANCGYRLDAPTWSPPAPKIRTNLNGLFRNLFDTID